MPLPVVRKSVGGSVPSARRAPCAAEASAERNIDALQLPSSHVLRLVCTAEPMLTELSLPMETLLRSVAGVVGMANPVAPLRNAVLLDSCSCAGLPPSAKPWWMLSQAALCRTVCPAPAGG